MIFIGIDGHGGAGKSTLAQALGSALGAEVLHTDDFASFDNPIDWWPLVIEHVFEPIQVGASSLNYPRSKWRKDHAPKPVTNQPVTEVMILEGVTALRKEFRPYIDFGIYVETARNVCLGRGFERDRGKNGMSDDEVRLQWQEWAKDEDAYMKRDDPKEYANVTVDGTQPLEETVAKLKQTVLSIR